MPDGQGIDTLLPGDALDDVEMKFQFSFEVPFWTGILDQDLDLDFAYTQLAFFQACNEEYSSPLSGDQLRVGAGLPASAQQGCSAANEAQSVA